MPTFICGEGSVRLVFAFVQCVTRLIEGDLVEMVVPSNDESVGVDRRHVRRVGPSDPGEERGWSRGSD